MSLNGLETPLVQQAYNTAISEAAGWFLLKYISRDSVELYAQGKSGVSDARSAIASYQELSPLYGLLVYRRRKVLIKYLPEGTSRLLQARTTVHLQDVFEKYSPYETLLEISTAEGLSDTRLAAAFPLHTASPSVSTNVLGSLGEITEDAEEGNSPKQGSDAVSISSRTSRRPVTERKSSRTALSPAPPSPSPLGNEKFSALQPSSVSQYLVKEESGHRSITQLNPPAITEWTPADEPAADSISVKSGRSAKSGKSSKSGHNIISSRSPLGRSMSGEGDEYDKAYDELFKPKIKLGPRPVNVSETSKRSAATSRSRPVSSLPAGMQISPKQSNTYPPSIARSTSDSIAPSVASPSTLPLPPPIPDEYERYPPRPSSRGSSRSIALSTRTAASAKTAKSAMTPEKQRLMKAMELRKKQMSRQRSSEASPDMVEASDRPEIKMFEGVQDKKVREVQEHDTQSQQSNKADSGIEMDDEGSPENDKNSATGGNAAIPFSPFITSMYPRSGASESDYNSQSRRSIAKQAPYGSDTTDGTVFENPSETTLKQERHSKSPSISITNTDVERSPRQTDSRYSHTGENNLGDGHEQGTTEISFPDPEQKNQDLQKKRRGFIEPLTVDTHRESVFVDEEFYEELQCATFQEAKPILMSRSPASPFFNRRPSARSANSSRSGVTTASMGPSITSVPAQKVISISEDGKVDPVDQGSRNENQEQHSPVKPRKSMDVEQDSPGRTQRKVSSGLSKRIQALAEAASKEGKLSPSYVSTHSRHASLRDAGEPRTSISDWQQKDPNKLSPWTTSVSTTSNGQSKHKSSASRDSISVTARIVRPPPGQEGASAMPVELQHSPLLINHNRTVPKHEFPAMAEILSSDSVTALPQQDENVPPEAVTKKQTPAIDAEPMGRKSFSRFRRPNHDSLKKADIPESTSTPSFVSVDKEEQPPHSSRTSRFFKRFSMGGGKRKSAISNTPAPPLPTSSPLVPTTPTTLHVSIPLVAPQSRPVSTMKDVPPPVVIGDLNVQFPDNLLWKRRFTEIDEGGNLVFKASRPTSAAGKGFSTNFHLSALQAPRVPDVDAQEMPHSVVLDMADGSGATLTCASEDAMAQRQLLSLLRTHHQAWATSG